MSRIGDWDLLRGEIAAEAGKPGSVFVVVVLTRLVSEANAHTHWRYRQKRAKAQRAAFSWAWAFANGPRGTRECPLIPKSVTITRRAPRRLDSDNLAGAAKHVRDQVAEELGFDDRNPAVEWIYKQEKTTVYGCVVEVQW